MKAPAFWWQPQRSLAAHLLMPVGAAVGAVTLWRMERGSTWRAPVPVFCVGNPTVGGSGKTPVAIALAGALRAAGASPVFLSRGYGGALSGPVIVDPHVHSAADVGDEPRLLAQHGPAVIAANRAAGAALAATVGDAIVMDDGFQNPAIEKDFAILLVDAAVGFGNGAVTPAGPMRAPYGPQAARADAVLTVDAGEGLPAPMPAGVSGTVRLVAEADRNLEGVKALAFAGIGRPEKFFASAAGLGARLLETRAFADHQPLRDDEASQLLADASGRGLALLTTQKDVARLGNSAAHSALRNAVEVVRIRAVLPPAITTAAEAVWRASRERTT